MLVDVLPHAWPADVRWFLYHTSRSVLLTMVWYHMHAFSTANHTMVPHVYILVALAAGCSCCWHLATLCYKQLHGIASAACSDRLKFCSMACYPGISIGALSLAGLR